MRSFFPISFCRLPVIAFCLMVAVAMNSSPCATAPTAPPQSTPSITAPRKIAAIVTTYHHNSHADVIVSRFLQTDTLDFKGRKYPLELASLYTDQIHEKDISRQLAAEHKFPIYENVADALTLGTGKLAVEEYSLLPSMAIILCRRRAIFNIPSAVYSSRS